MPSNDDEPKIKKYIATALALFQLIAEIASVFCYFIFSLIFIYLFIKSGVLYYKSDDLIVEKVTDIFIQNILSSFEFLFIAPIPILIIFAFKGIMVKIYPSYFNNPEFDSKNSLNLLLAKKTFISSIIGVLSTFILKLFLDDIFITAGVYDVMMVYKILLFLAFLLILIFYYKILSNHTE